MKPGVRYKRTMTKDLPAAYKKGEKRILAKKVRKAGKRECQWN